MGPLFLHRGCRECERLSTMKMIILPSLPHCEAWVPCICSTVLPAGMTEPVRQHLSCVGARKRSAVACQAAWLTIVVMPTRIKPQDCVSSPYCVKKKDCAAELFDDDIKLGSDQAPAVSVTVGLNRYRCQRPGRWHAARGMGAERGCAQRRAGRRRPSVLRPRHRSDRRAMKAHPVVRQPLHMQPPPVNDPPPYPLDQAGFRAALTEALQRKQDC